MILAKPLSKVSRMVGLRPLATVAFLVPLKHSSPKGPRLSSSIHSASLSPFKCSSSSCALVWLLRLRQCLTRTSAAFLVRLT